MKQKDLISIIVPVYNVEDFLERCIVSIINQTYANFELLLIDDGSIDKSAEICKKWVVKDTRIKYFYKENGGVSSARNRGIKEAKGKYIGFVDPDDWLDETMYEELYTLLEKNYCDVAVCRLIRVYDEKEKIEEKRFKTQIFLDGMIDQRQLIQSDDLVSCLTKLYKACIFDKLRFPENMSHAEDLYIVPDILSRASRVIYTSKILYYYFMRNSSASHNFSESKALNRLEARSKFYAYLKQKKSYLNYAFYSLLDAYVIGYKYINDKRKIKQDYRSFFWDNKKKSVLSLKCILFLISPRIYLFMLGLYLKIKA